MKKLLIISLISAGLAACVEDEGNYDYTTLNQVKIEGLEDSYNVLDKIDVIHVEPVVTGTLLGEDDSQYAYQWHIHEGISEHKHTIIGHEKNLDYRVNLGVGSYTLYLTVLDKSTGLKTLASAPLKVSTGVSKGYLLLGDDPSTGEMGLDMVAMPAGRDTSVVENVFDNSEKHLKGADRILYQGARYNHTQSLWMCCDDGSFRMNNVEDISIVSELNNYGMIEIEFPHQKPMRIKDVFPRQTAMSSANNSYNRSGSYRGYLTEDVAVFNMIMTAEYYATPCNRTSAVSNTLFRFYPLAFCLGSNYSAEKYVMLYNKDEEKFMKINTNFNATHCISLTDYANDVFYWDQRKYDKPRTIVWGDNSCNGSYGSSFALMKDTEGKYYLYKFNCGPYSASKLGSYEIDLDKAPHFAEASHYTVSGTGSIMMYTYGSTLYLYDYTYKSLMSRDFGAEITFLDYDFCTDASRTAFIIATYSDSEKGVVRRLDVGTDPNVLEVIDRPKDVWHTRLRIKDVEWKRAY